MPMTEAAIDSGFTRDIYVSLGEPLEEGNAWIVRIYYKPFISWIWAAALLMAWVVASRLPIAATASSRWRDGRWPKRLRRPRARPGPAQEQPHEAVISWPLGLFFGAGRLPRFGLT
jgi:hypothetical protein